MEAEERITQTDFSSLTDEELDALILGQLTEWCRDGWTLEEIGESMKGFGCDHIVEKTAENYIWNPEMRIVTRREGSPD